MKFKWAQEILSYFQTSEQEQNEETYSQNGSKNTKNTPDRKRRDEKKEQLFTANYSLTKRKRMKKYQRDTNICCVARECVSITPVCCINQQPFLLGTGGSR